MPNDVLSNSIEKKKYILYILFADESYFLDEQQLEADADGSSFIVPRKNLEDFVTAKTDPHGLPFYVCGLCEFKSPLKQTVLRHLKTKHSARSNEKCPYCGSMYKNKYSLRAHLYKKTCLKNFVFTDTN